MLFVSRSSSIRSGAALFLIAVLFPAQKRSHQQRGRGVQTCPSIAIRMIVVRVVSALVYTRSTHHLKRMTLPSAPWEYSPNGYIPYGASVQAFVFMLNKSIPPSAVACTANDTLLCQVESKFLPNPGAFGVANTSNTKRAAIWSLLFTF